MTILKNVVAFSGLLIGVPVALPHGLNVNGTPVVPQLVLPAAGGYTITANATAITVTRLATGAAAVQVFAERWHSIEDVLPVTELAGLVPFIPNLTGVSGTTTVVSDGVSIDGDGSLGDPLAVIDAGVTPTLTVTAIRAATTSIIVGAINRYDGTAVAFALNLPAANTVAPGALVAVKEVAAGTNAVTLQPVAGDNLGLGAGVGLPMSTAYRGYVLASDGGTQWMLLGTYPP